MKQEDLIWLCNAIGNLAGIPIRLYQAGKLVHYHAMVDLPRDPLCLCEEAVFAIREHVGYYVTPQFLYYGVVNAGENRIVLGPSRQIDLQEQQLREIAFLADVDSDDVPAFITGMKQIVHLPLESVIQMLCTVNFVLNSERLSLSDVTLRMHDHDTFLRRMAVQQLERDLAEENVDVHNTLAVEQTIMNIIRKGDVAALEQFATNAPAVRPGVMAADQLRQARNAFIVTVSLASRSAIRGGMDVEEALTTSDQYIQQCELLNDLAQISTLTYSMVLHYTGQVARIRLSGMTGTGQPPSVLITDVSGYIHRHLSNPITTEEIARHLYMSRQHLSRQFHRDAGMTLSAFIAKEKTEEAKRLLRYTDKSIAAIAAYLGYSSQGHFTRVFHRGTGITPGEYRQRHSK